MGGPVRGLSVPVRDAPLEGPLRGGGPRPGDLSRRAEGPRLLFRELLRIHLAGRHPQAQDRGPLPTPGPGGPLGGQRPPGTSRSLLLRRVGTLDIRARPIGAATRRTSTGKRNFSISSRNASPAFPRTMRTPSPSGRSRGRTPPRSVRF